jgi:hypothetical protein
MGHPQAVEDLVGLAVLCRTGEDKRVLDVHAPHEPIYSWREFFIHLATITIGLLIALSLEGCVEFWHHRSLVHEAQASLQTEIAANAREVQKALENVREEQKVLRQDVVMLRKIIANPKAPNQETPVIKFNLPSFDEVSWETAKSTGALSYMPYEQAHEYSELYNQQNDVDAAEQQATRDVVLSVAPFLNLEQVAPKLTAEDAPLVKQRIEVLQAQLYVVESLTLDLDKKYKKFLAAHPE